MTTTLAIITPDSNGAPIALPESGRITIGSSSERADVVIASQGVADVHCVITRKDDGGWTVQDMGSEFGTVLDGKRVDVANLNAGQTLLLGSASVQVLEHDPEAPETPEASPQTPSPQPVPESPTGDGILNIPGYSIQETLGRGGMGAVFLARQDRLHRDVALKILSPRLSADTAFVGKFHREAQAAAAFNHPNVVTVYDVGEASGTHYLAMEYMDGESLEDLLNKEGRLPWRRVTELLLGAARGLVYAESKGIVHRDIKPSNLMLNSQGQVKLADLGLAQRADDDSGDGRVFGTPHFMPPEQIRGEPVDRRSDIYALGATGYRLLSGYTPFEGVNSREILRAVLTEEFEPLSAHVTGVPSSLTTLIERMISRSPEQRPQSAESVTAHLEAALSDRPAPSSPNVKARPAKPSKSGAPLLIGLGACVAAFFVWKSTQGQEPAPRPSPTDTSIAQADPQDTPLEPAPDPPNGNRDDNTQDDDFTQKLFEIEAERDLLRLQSSSQSLPERQASLLALAQKYDGTTAAVSAREQATQVAEVMRLEVEAAAAITSRREAVLFALHDAAGLDSSPPRPGDALRAMAAVPNQDLLVDDEPFESQRAALRVTVCTRALDQAQTQITAAKESLSEGDRAAVHDSLQDLVIRLQLPEIVQDQRPEGYEGLRRIASEARDLMRNLDTHRADIVQGRMRDDAEAIASTCRSSNGVETKLSELRPGEAATLLEALAETLNTDESRATIQELAEDLHRAAKALEALTSDFQSWRRNTITDPRPRRGNTEVSGLSPDGITVQGSNGPEQIQWSAFADQPEALHQLFNRRLPRNWTDDEELGIAALIRHAAVLNSIRSMRPGMADPSALRERDVERALAAYQPASNWARGSTQSELLELEVAAATSLMEGLMQANDGQWSSATSTLEHTTRTYKGTLLLLMLSDGSNSSPDPEPGAEAAEAPPLGLDPEGPDVPSPSDPGGG